MYARPGDRKLRRPPRFGRRVDSGLPGRQRGNPSGPWPPATPEGFRPALAHPPRRAPARSGRGAAADSRRR